MAAAGSTTTLNAAEREAASAMELLTISRERLARATAAAPQSLPSAGAGSSAADGAIEESCVPNPPRPARPPVGLTRRPLGSLSPDEVSHLLSWLELDAYAGPLRSAGMTGEALARADGVALAELGVKPHHAQRLRSELAALGEHGVPLHYVTRPPSYCLGCLKCACRPSPAHAAACAANARPKRYRSRALSQVLGPGAPGRQERGHRARAGGGARSGGRGGVCRGAVARGAARGGDACPSRGRGCGARGGGGRGGGGGGGGGGACCGAGSRVDHHRPRRDGLLPQVRAPLETESPLEPNLREARR